MAQTPEGIAEISNLLHEVSVGGEQYLGTVDKGVRVVRRVFDYQLRYIYDPEQPHVYRWTRQPAVGLEIDGVGVIPLPYAKDVEELGQPLAGKVLDHLRVLKARARV